MYRGKKHYCFGVLSSRDKYPALGAVMKAGPVTHDLYKPLHCIHTHARLPSQAQ